MRNTGRIRLACFVLATFCAPVVVAQDIEIQESPPKPAIQLPGLQLKPNNPLQWKEVLTSRILPGGCTEKTSDALDAVIAKYARFSPKPEQLGRFIVGILLGSPEFQRQ